MIPLIMNARMYAVTPEVERGWQQLLGHVAQDAGVALRYVAYPAPQPLERALGARGPGPGVHVRVPDRAAARAGRADRRAHPER